MEWARAGPNKYLTGLLHPLTVSTAKKLGAKLMKSWMMEESGGSPRAFASDAFQVNVPGDWAPEKARIAGLQEGRAMTPQTSADGALKWLVHKARTHRDDNDDSYRGPYWTPYEAFRNYNARRKFDERDRSDEANRFDNRYAIRILGRARD
jgi:hypothetical protein